MPDNVPDNKDPWFARMKLLAPYLMTPKLGAEYPPAETDFWEEMYAAVKERLKADGFIVGGLVEPVAGSEGVGPDTVVMESATEEGNKQG